MMFFMVKMLQDRKLVRESNVRLDGCESVWGEMCDEGLSEDIEVVLYFSP